MSDKKNIDRLFQEKFKDFDAIPNDTVWEGIENELHKNKRKRRVIPLWWKVAGVAALLALLFTVGNSILNNSISNNTTTNPVVDSKETDLNRPEIDKENVNTILLENTNTTKNIAEEDVDSNLLTNSSEKNNPIVATTNNTSNKKKRAQQNDAIASNTYNTFQENKVTNANKTKDAVVNTNSNLPESNLNNPLKDPSEMDALIKNSTQNTVVDVLKKDEESKEEEIEDITIEEAIANSTDNEKEEEEEEEEEKLSRWSVSPNVAPVYFNTLGKGSSIDNQFINNSKSGEVNMSYGIAGSYAINKKFKIRAGINKVELGYSTNNVIVYTGLNGAASGFTNGNGLRNIKFNDPSQNALFLNAENLSFAAVPQVLANNIKASLDQRLGFIEIPIEIEYNIIDKKIGLNVISGFSTLFLNKNEVYSTLNGDRSLLGEATNINNMSYSANFGIGIDYKVSEKIKINLEPTFKYQINTFKDSSGDFQPYFIGVYTGLSYKF